MENIHFDPIERVAVSENTLVKPGFCAVLREWGSSFPDKVAMNLVDSKGAIKSSLTYGQLWEQTGILATHLLNEGLRAQDRVMIIYPITSILEYFTAFIACLRIGVVPVSIYPPNPKKLKKDLAKFETFLGNAQSSFAITTAEYKLFVQVSSLTNKWPSGIKKWLATDSLLKKSATVKDSDVNYEHSDFDLTFIQYTSGSTGNPKGVPIHHASLMNSVEYLREDATLKFDIQRTFFWLPIYHDYGLISTLANLFSGTTLYLTDPITFISNPIIWVEVMEKYAINATAGPNFSYALTSRKLRESGKSKQYDLSNLRYISIAAEMIYKETIDAICADFGARREAVQHMYGAAEACIWMSTEKSIFDDNEIAACGNVNLSEKFGMSIVIADSETFVTVEDGVTGEVFVKGRGMARNYWNNPEASKAFEKNIVGHDGKWYGSGDLGYIKNGSLYITGRIKDVIIVNGKNIYATDIERDLEESAIGDFIRTGCSAAFQTGDDTIAVLCELKPGKESNVTAESLEKIKAELELEFGLQVTNILCCAKGTVPKTTSGKVRRSEAKRMFLDNEITAETKLQQFKKCATFDELLQQFDIEDSNATLNENGVDSLKLTRLIEEAKDQFDLTLDFEAAQTVSCRDLEQHCRENGRSRYAQKPPLPEMEAQGKRVKNLVLIQIFGVMVIVTVFCISTIPSAYLYQWLTSAEFIEQHPSIAEPWLTVFKTGPGFIFIIVPLCWMMTFSLIVILLKWTVIGRYKTISTAIWSFDFAKWWLMDRLLNIWERFVGGYLVDTPLLNMFYILLGANIPIMSCRLKTFLREPDLVTAGKNTEISGIFLTNYINNKSLCLDHIAVEENVKLQGSDVTYPGEVVTTETKSTVKSPSMFLQIQRILFPIVLILCFTANSYLMSWILQNWITETVPLFSARIFVTFMSSYILLLVISSMLLFFGSLFSYTVDALANVGFSFLHLWVHVSPLVPLIHRVLYGTRIDIDVQMNGLSSISPSEGRFVTIKSGASISTCSIEASNEKNVTIGKSCTVGLGCVIKPGVTMEDNSVVASLAIVPEGLKIASGNTYYSGSYITKGNQAPPKAESALIFAFYTSASILIKILTVWTSFGVMIAVPIYLGYLFVQATKAWTLVPQLLLTELIVLFAAGFILCVFDFTASMLFVPSTKTRLQIPLCSFRSGLYSTAITMSTATDSYILLFFRGTVFVPLFLRLKGSKIADIRKVLLMGITYDPKLLSIGDKRKESENDYIFVLGENSLFEGHALQNGNLILEPTTAKNDVVLGPGSLVMAGQEISNRVHLAPRSRVFFQQKVIKTKSGIYNGIPAKECL